MPYQTLQSVTDIAIFPSTTGELENPLANDSAGHPIPHASKNEGLSIWVWILIIYIIFKILSFAFFGMSRIF